MERPSDTEEAHRIVRNYQIISLLALAVLGTGMVFYHFVEGWRWLDALYFTVISLTTVGYGDFSPQTDAGKLFTIGFLFIGIGIMTALISNLLRSRLAKQQLRQQKNSYNKRR